MASFYHFCSSEDDTKHLIHFEINSFTPPEKVPGSSQHWLQQWNFQYSILQKSEFRHFLQIAKKVFYTFLSHTLMSNNECYETENNQFVFPVRHHSPDCSFPFPLRKSSILLLALTMAPHTVQQEKLRTQTPQNSPRCLSCLFISSTFPCCLCISHWDELHQISCPLTHEYHSYITFLSSAPR